MPEPNWWAHATEEQRARHRAAVSKGQKLAWQRGRKGNYRHPKGRSASLAAQGIPPDCVRFYWLARTIVGYHNPYWTTDKIISLITWFTGLPNVGAGPEGLRKWFKWLLGTHRINCHERMKPEYRHRLPEIEANYQEWMAKLEDRKPPARQADYSNGSFYVP
jgi:hypothetical protein